MVTWFEVGSFCMRGQVLSAKGASEAIALGAKFAQDVGGVREVPCISLGNVSVVVRTL